MNAETESEKSSLCLCSGSKFRVALSDLQMCLLPGIQHSIER